MNVTVVPDSITLAPGESCRVTVTVSEVSGVTGDVNFPVQGGADNGLGKLLVTLPAAAVVFTDPQNPSSLPLKIERKSMTAMSAVYEVAALGRRVKAPKKRRFGRS